LDITRFWNWQDSPIPLQPTEIAPIQTGSRGQPEDLKPGQLGQPVLNIINPSTLPDPAGLGAVLGAIQNGNMFRDMSGLAGLQELAKSIQKTTADASTDAGQIASANLRTEAQKQIAYAQIAGDIAKALIGGAPGGSSVQGISGDGARINHGRDMDQRGVPPVGGGTTGSGGTGGGSRGGNSAGANSSSGGGGNPSGKSGGFSHEAAQSFASNPLASPVGQGLLQNVSTAIENADTPLAKLAPYVQVVGNKVPKIGSNLTFDIDVSGFQKRIDWDKVRHAQIWLNPEGSPTNAGGTCEFAYLKVSEAASVSDKTYAYNTAECRRVGLQQGGYHFYHLDGDPVRQAQNFLSNLSYQDGDLPPAIDLEYPGSVNTPEKITQFNNNVRQNLTKYLASLQVFLDEIKNRTGASPIFYVGKDF
jgi:hypothetical protein